MKEKEQQESNAKYEEALEKLRESGLVIDTRAAQRGDRAAWGGFVHRPECAPKSTVSTVEGHLGS